MVVEYRGCLANREESWPRPARNRAGGWNKSLELQATLAGGVGQGLDATVVAVTGAIEGDLLDTCSLGLLGDRLADLYGGIGVLAVLQAFHHVGLHGRGGSQDLRTIRGEYLGVQMLAGAQHRQARHAELADVRTGRLGATQAGDVLVHCLILES